MIRASKISVLLLCLMQISILVLRFTGHIQTSPTMWVVSWVSTFITFASAAFVFYITRRR